MRLMTWNCRGGLKNKHAVITSVNPDVLIVQEGSRDDCRALAPHDKAVYWRAKSTTEKTDKGLGVVCLNPSYELGKPALPDPWKAMEQDDPQRLDVLLPVEVRGPHSFNLLGVWSFNNREKGRSVMGKLESPVTLAARYLEEWLGEDKAVVAGDFNHTPSFDRYNPVNKFSKNVDPLEACGLSSVYHYCRECRFGEEADKTYVARGKFYSIDYIFADLVKWRAEFDLMTFDDLDRLNVKSDHVPLWCDLKL